MLAWKWKVSMQWILLTFPVTWSSTSSPVATKIDNEIHIYSDSMLHEQKVESED